MALPPGAMSTQLWFVVAAVATEKRIVTLLPTATAMHGPGTVPLKLRPPFDAPTPATTEKVKLPSSPFPSHAAGSGPAGGFPDDVPVPFPGVVPEPTIEVPVSPRVPT